jgi:CBS domain-containing protein
MGSRVRDVMTRDPVTVSPEATLREVAETLSAKHISGVPVVAPGRGLIGVISATDLMDFVATEPGVPTERPDQTEWGEFAPPTPLEMAGTESGSFYTDYWDDAGADLLERFRAVSGPEWNVLEEHTAAEVMSRRVVCIGPEAAIHDAARAMLAESVHRLLVVDAGRLEGIITGRDLMHVLADAGESESGGLMNPVSDDAVTLRTVADIMQHRAITVPADTSLTEVARVLWDEQIGGVPVIDESDRPIGFVSASDLVRFKAFGSHYEPPAAAGTRGLTAHEVAPFRRGLRQRRPGRMGRAADSVASDVMTPATFAVRSTTSVVELARFLVRAGVHRALVIDDGRLTGVVSAFDIVQDLAVQEAAVAQPNELPAPTTAG